MLREQRTPIAQIMNNLLCPKHIAGRLVVGPIFRPHVVQILLHASRYAGEGVTEVAMGSTVGIIPYN